MPTYYRIIRVVLLIFKRLRLDFPYLRYFYGELLYLPTLNFPNFIRSYQSLKRESVVISNRICGLLLRLHLLPFKCARYSFSNVFGSSNVVVIICSMLRFLLRTKKSTESRRCNSCILIVNQKINTFYRTAVLLPKILTPPRYQVLFFISKSQKTVVK